MNHQTPTNAQQQLLNFINPTDAGDIAKSLKAVFNMALYENNNTLNSKQKDDLYYLDNLIAICNSINKEGSV